MGDSISSSIAYDVNASGILVGSYRSYIQGYYVINFSSLIPIPRSCLCDPK